MTFPPKVWDGVLRRLKDAVPRVSFETWIRDLDARPVAGGLALRCPSSFHRDRVRDQFLTIIRECTAQELGKSIAVHVEVAEAETSSSAEKPIDSEQPARQSAPGSRGSVRSSGNRAGIKSNSSRSELHEPVRLSAVMRRAIGRQGSDAPVDMQANSAPGKSPKTLRPHQEDLPRRLQEQSPTLSFDSFAVGPCNALAREAAMAIANQKQAGLQQLYLTSPPGLGKTHLSQAVMMENRRTRASKARYATAESFTNEFTQGIRSGRMAEFKQRYRKHVDLLIVEDIQFFIGKQSTQLEFFHTVQHVLDCGGRVILTGDRFPQELGELDERVRTRIANGFVAEIEHPDAAVRRNILRAKAARGGIRLPDDCLELLVENVQGNVRELEGALIQLVTTASLQKQPIDIELARSSMRRRIRRSGNDTLRPTPIEIIKVVASFFRTTPVAMASRSRRRDVLVPRQLAMYLCRRYTEAPLSEIGRALNRDHPAVANAVRRVERDILEKVPLRYQVESLICRLDEIGYTPIHPQH